MPKGGLEPPRVTSHAPQTCASTSSATSARPGRLSKNSTHRDLFLSYYFVAAGLAAGDSAAAGVAVASGVAAGVGVASGVASGMPDCKTDLLPLNAGNESDNAISINAAAAPMVIFASSVCVPRGPNAVLETELENSAPASDLPG